MLRHGRMGWVLASVVCISWGPSVSPATAQALPQTQIINELIAKSWESAELKPSKKADDYEFCRRVFIDLIGRIPSYEEVIDFVTDSTKDKRASLIRRLLYEKEYVLKNSRDPKDPKKPRKIDYASEYAQHMANIWTVWLMTRGGVNEMYHNQMRLWLEEQFAQNIKHTDFVRKLVTATGKTNQNQAVNFMVAHLGEMNPADKRISEGVFDAVPITARVTRLFLGIQTQCTQCHDHPFNPDWKQENFWGVNAFLKQVNRDVTPTPAVVRRQLMKLEPVQVTLFDDPKLNRDGLIYFERRSGALMPIKPTFLADLADLGKDKIEKRKIIPEGSSKTRREILADYLLEHDNFAPAQVNRMWGHLFGRGLNANPAFDDFGDHNKVVHEELLKRLSAEFKQYGYDNKQLLTWICNSDAYQLTSQTNGLKDSAGGNAKPEHEAYFSRMLLKNMSPEVLFESLMEATRSEVVPNADEKKALRERWMDRLVRNFGDDEGNEVTFNGTIIQALMMMNGEELNKSISEPGGTVSKALSRYKKGPVNETNVVNEIFIAALGRPISKEGRIEYRNVRIDPRTKKEVEGAIQRTTEVGVVMGKLAEYKKSAEFQRWGYQVFFEDLFWSLLNTNEFILNH